MGKEKRDKTQSYVDALKHPLRRRILRLAVDRNQELSPVQLSRDLDERLSNVSYHVRVLADHGLLALASQRPRRGAVEHFYVLSPAALEHPMVKAILEEV